MRDPRVSEARRCHLCSRAPQVGIVPALRVLPGAAPEVIQTRRYLAKPPQKKAEFGALPAVLLRSEAGGQAREGHGRAGWMDGQTDTARACKKKISLCWKGKMAGGV